MREDYPSFRKEIYAYCDKNVGEKALFYAFMNLWHENEPITHRDLMSLTERILKELLKKNILVEIQKPEELQTPFPYYKINPHEDLIQKDNFVRKRMELLSN